jgi:hypothetical protein
VGSLGLVEGFGPEGLDLLEDGATADLDNVVEGGSESMSESLGEDVVCKLEVVYVSAVEWIDAAVVAWVREDWDPRIHLENQAIVRCPKV